ncbi:MAG: hypothetical protein ACTSYD_14075 [Candidatus Heimdallarchaeaceae archaeon]
MVLTAKDLVSTKPILKKPKTFNPLGGICTGLLLGGAHSLLAHTIVVKDIAIGFLTFSIILQILSLISFYATISLSGKYSSFILRTSSPPKQFQSMLAEQILMFYIGFVPSYGFTLSYSIQGLDFKKIVAVLIIIMVGFFAGLYYNTKLMKKKEVRLGHLLQLMFQVKKGIFLLLSGIIVTATALLIALW